MKKASPYPLKWMCVNSKVLPNPLISAEEAVFFYFLPVYSELNAATSPRLQSPVLRSLLFFRTIPAFSLPRILKYSFGTEMKF